MLVLCWWLVSVGGLSTNKTDMDQKGNGKKKTSPQRIVSARTSDEIIEMVYEREKEKTAFLCWDGSEVSVKRSFASQGRQMLPYSATNPLVRRGIVNFASEAQEYGSAEQLFSEIRAYIHRYVDVSGLFERIAAYYVMLTWVFDAFNEVPYLRLRGDYGCGKTRFLLIAGSLCYKSFFSSGASTTAPIFHMLNDIGGTLVLDEGDMRFSDAKSDMVKILNNGTVRDMPVLRCEKANQYEFRPKAYEVFAPKIIATRGYFNDNALESRFISEEMGQKSVRKDIPAVLGSEYKQRALVLRNKLLMYRFRNLNNISQNLPDAYSQLSGRLNQMFLPLLAVVSSQQDREDIIALAKSYQHEHNIERSQTAAAYVTAIIAEHVCKKGWDAPMRVRDILYIFIERHISDYGRRITGKWIGYIVRKKLLLKTYRRGGEFYVEISQERLERLCELYGVAMNLDLQVF